MLSKLLPMNRAEPRVAKGLPSAARSGVARGGATRPGCHHFGVTPYYGVKPYLHPFVVNIFFFTLFGPYPHLDQKSTAFAAKTFFIGLH